MRALRKRGRMEKPSWHPSNPKRRRGPSIGTCLCQSKSTRRGPQRLCGTSRQDGSRSRGLHLVLSTKARARATKTRISLRPRRRPPKTEYASASGTMERAAVRRKIAALRMCATSHYRRDFCAGRNTRVASTKADNQLSRRRLLTQCGAKWNRFLHRYRS